MRPKSITFRLTLFFSTASTAVLLVVGYLIGTLVEAHFEELDLAELDGKLELVRHTLAKARTAADMAVVPESLADALVGHPGLSVAVVGSDRKLLFSENIIEYRDQKGELVVTARGVGVRTERPADQA